MRYIEKKGKVLNRVVIFRQRKKKSRGLAVDSTKAFRGFHCWRWSLYVSKANAKRPIKNI
jgi:hypothetical protein